MGVALSMTIVNDNEGTPDLEFFINKKGNISVVEQGDEITSMYTEISKEDWHELKKFIDERLADG